MMARRRAASGRNRGGARRGYTPAAYGADYLHNLRWRYGTSYGTGSEWDPYRWGGSFGRGYQRADDLGARGADPGPYPLHGYASPYHTRHPGGTRYRPRGSGRRPGTAARDYGYAYPYFSSPAAMEAAQGYPPADTLNPELYPSPLGWGVGDYGEEYEPPGEVAERWHGRRLARPPRGSAPVDAWRRRRRGAREGRQRR